MAPDCAHWLTPPENARSEDLDESQPKALKAFIDCVCEWADVYAGFSESLEKPVQVVDS